MIGMDMGKVMSMGISKDMTLGVIMIIWAVSLAPASCARVDKIAVASFQSIELHDKIGHLHLQGPYFASISEPSNAKEWALDGLGRVAVRTLWRFELDVGASNR